MLAKSKLEAFKQNMASYTKFYDPQALFAKIKSVAKSVGIRGIYLVLILYYATFDKSLPLKDRMMVMAALGYFILPLDMLPDTLPGGYVDDSAALMYVAKHIWSNLSPATSAKASARLREWFPDVKDSDFNLPGFS